MNDDSRPVFSAIPVPRAADILADQVRDLIISGQLPPGSFLPTERQLVSDSKLSRTSVRDALRVLESEGLISTKVGRSGGSMVTLPRRQAIARSVELFVRTHGIRLKSLLECRVAVEPMLAGLAAVNRTPAQLARIETIHDRLMEAIDDVPQYKALNLDWHLAIAQASGNEPLTALMEAITEPIRDAMDYRSVTTSELRQGAVAAHVKIIEAIAKRDEDAAYKRMYRHVAAYRAVVAEDERADDEAGEPRQDVQ